MKKQIFAAILSAAMITSLSTGTLSVQADPEYSIGVVQLNEMDLFNDVTMGFETAVMDGLGNDAVLFDEMTAEGNAGNYASVINGFLSENDNLIFVSSNEMLSAALSVTDSVPVIGASVSKFSGSNVAGITSIATYAVQADLLRSIQPDAKTVGIVYSEGDAFAKEQADGMETALSNVGLNCTIYTFSGDISSAASSAADENDVIYVPADTGIFANASALASISKEKETPVITADEETCSICGLAVVSAAPYDMGYAAGEIAVRVLKGEAPSSIGVNGAPIIIRKYNNEFAEFFRVMIPDDFESIESVSVESENDGIEELTDEQAEEIEKEMNEVINIVE